MCEQKNVIEFYCFLYLQAYGGDDLVVRLYRTYFRTRSTLADRWRGNPVLTTVLLGLPLGFLCFILYSCCCSDILDAEEDDEEGIVLNYNSIFLYTATDNECNS